MQNANELESFRSDVRAWVTDNLPASLQGADLASIAGGESGAKASDTVKAGMEAWRQKLAEKGWGAPTWPVEYGGAGLTDPHADIIGEEIHRAGAYTPIPLMRGWGGPLVVRPFPESGAEDKKRSPTDSFFGFPGRHSGGQSRLPPRPPFSHRKPRKAQRSGEPP